MIGYYFVNEHGIPCAAIDEPEKATEKDIQQIQLLLSVPPANDMTLELPKAYFEHPIPDQNYLMN